MRCPYCEQEMEKGVIQTGDVLSSHIKAGESVVWIPESESKKFIPNHTVHLDVNAEGYYCKKCAKAVAVFNERGAGFWQ